MLWIERIALALLAFGFAGLGLMAWQPAGMAGTTQSSTPAYELAISSGAKLRLIQNGTPTTAAPGLLSCDTVFSIGKISIGTRCISRGWEVSLTD